MPRDGSDKKIEFEIYWYHIQCLMCKFDFVEGEQIVANLEKYGFSKAFVFHKVRSCYRIEQTSESYMRKPATDNLIGSCLHLQCYRRSDSSAIASRRYDVTLCGFTPSDSHQKRRARYLVDLLSSKLFYHESWPRKLPYEVWRMIASYLVRETAMTTALGRDSMPLSPSYFSYGSINPTYASFIKIDGRHYIRKEESSLKDLKTLTSSSRNASDKSEFIFQLPLLGKRRYYFVAVDAFGVLQVFPVSPRQREAWCRNHPTIPGAWWYLERAFPKPTDPYLPDIYWKIPIANPPTIVDLGTLQEPPGRLCLRLRMRFFECNSPDIVGYSVALDQRGNILTIFSHKRDQEISQTSLPLVPGLEEITDPAELSLVFMPLHQDERITEIYGMVRKKTSFRLAGISFSTDKGRTITFGPSRPEAFHVKRLVRMPPKPCRVFINELEHMERIFMLRFIAFEGDKNHPFPPPQDALPTLPESRQLPSMKSIDGWKYWYTSCSMKGASKIYPCVDGVASSRWYQTLTGLLVEFADGRRESIGWVRPDWLTEPIVLYRRDNLYIHRAGNQLFFEGTTFETQKPETRRNKGRLDVRQSDTLEWCFSIKPRRNLLSNGREDLG
ncbi:hypothetical protein NCS52_01275300 [Fusarium sp. LHS14.1]|nr:hypothetical protein NCS52_01275300 [Fusarium sp. LHS14.1]